MCIDVVDEAQVSNYCLLLSDQNERQLILIKTFSARAHIAVKSCLPKMKLMKLREGGGRQEDQVVLLVLTMAEIAFMANCTCGSRQNHLCNPHLAHPKHILHRIVDAE